MTIHLCIVLRLSLPSADPENMYDRCRRKIHQNRKSIGIEQSPLSDIICMAQMGEKHGKLSFNGAVVVAITALPPSKPLFSLPPNHCMQILRDTGSFSFRVYLDRQAYLPPLMGNVQPIAWNGPQPHRCVCGCLEALLFERVRCVAAEVRCNG